MKSKDSKKKGRPPAQQIVMSLYQWELASGRDAVTIKKRCMAKDIDCSNGLSLPDFLKAMLSGREQAMERKIEEETKKIIREEQVAIGQLVDRTLVESELWSELLPFRNALFALAKKKGCEGEMDKIMAEHFKAAK